MLFLHGGETEIGGFGVSRSDDDLLYLEDFVTVAQQVSVTTVAFDDAAVADYFDERVDAGLAPARFARVWVHTHPGDSPDPSLTDEQTFARVFGPCDWAIMLIVSRTGRTYCRLSFSAGPGGSVLLPVRVDWAAWPDLLLEHAEEFGSVFESWMDEYGSNIAPAMQMSLTPPVRSADPSPWSADYWREDDLYGALEQQADEMDEGQNHKGRRDRLVELFEMAGEVGS